MNKRVHKHWRTLYSLILLVLLEGSSTRSGTNRRVVSEPRGFENAVMHIFKPRAGTGSKLREDEFHASSCATQDSINSRKYLHVLFRINAFLISKSLQ